MARENETVDAIAAGTTDQRLAGIIRRHGGTPKPTNVERMKLPAPKRGLSPDQMTIDQAEPPPTATEPKRRRKT